MVSIEIYLVFSVDGDGDVTATGQALNTLCDLRSLFLIHINEIISIAAERVLSEHQNIDFLLLFISKIITISSL